MTTVLSEPFPAKDRIVDRQGKPTEALIRYFESQDQTINSAASSIGSATSTAGAASVSTTPITSQVIANGVYRASWYMEVVTPAGVSSSLDITIAWTSNGVAKSNTSSAMTGNTTTSYASGVLTIHADGDSIVSYQATYASNPAAAMIYGLWVVLERVG